MASASSSWSPRSLGVSTRLTDSRAALAESSSPSPTIVMGENVTSPSPSGASTAREDVGVRCGEDPCPPGGPQARQLTPEPVPRRPRPKGARLGAPGRSQVVEAGVRGLSRTPDSASAGGGPNQRCRTHHAPSATRYFLPGVRSDADGAGVDFLSGRGETGAVVGLLPWT